MSSISLNNFFTNQQEAAARSFKVPLGGVFAQLQDKPAAHLQTLRQRTEEFNSLQQRLTLATTDQLRDSVVVCITIAITIGLIAGVVLGILYYCPPAIIVCASALPFFSLICSCIVQNLAESDKRKGCWDLGYDVNAPVGIPMLIYYLLTRKDALQEAIEPLQEGIRKDLKDAGEYLRTNQDRIREKIAKDIRECKRVIAKEKEDFPLDQFTAAQLKVAHTGTNWQKVIDQQAILLQELNGNGQKMVRLLQDAHIIV